MPKKQNKQTEVPNWIGYAIILLIILQILGNVAIYLYTKNSLENLDIEIKKSIEDIFTSASPTSNEGMELSLNPIPSQINNKNKGSGTKPSSRGI